MSHLVPITILRLSQTATGAAGGVAEWIRSAADRINSLIAATEVHQGLFPLAEEDIDALDTRLTAAENDITALQADKMAWVDVPASASATGTPGQVAYESGFFYICVDDDEWQRVAIATW